MFILVPRDCRHEFLERDLSDVAGEQKVRAHLLRR